MTAFLKDVIRKVWLITRDDNVRHFLMVVFTCEEGKKFLEPEDIGFCSDLSIKFCHCMIDVIAKVVKDKIRTRHKIILK